MDIIFKNVSYTYQPNTPFAHQALDDISFNIPSGTFVAIIGHTGSGKSTLIQHLNGLITPTKGEITIGDFKLTEGKKPRDIKRLRSKVGVVFQYPEHQLFEETVHKDIAFGPENFGVKREEIEGRIQSILPQIGLTEELLERSPFELSGGQMRRAAIAGVLAIEPEVFVLDEPTAGLDPRGQREIMEMFYNIHKEKKVTTVLVTHSMEDAMRYADHIIILNNGQKYIEGEPEEIFKHEKKLQGIHLNVPESFAFINRYMEKFNVTIPLKQYTIKEIACLIQSQIKEGINNE